LAAIDKALREGQTRQELAATLQRLPNGGSAKALTQPSFEEQMLPLLQQEETLLDDYGPNHPQVQSVRRRIALMRKLLTRSREENSAEPGDAVAKFSPEDPVAVYVRALKQERSAIEMAEQLLAERIKGEYEQAKRLAVYQSREEAFRDDMARGQQLYDGIIKRLQELNIVRDFGGYYARVITPPSGGRQIEPRASSIISVALFLGLLGGFGLAYLADITDKSFRTPEEIQRHLGVPVVGHVSRIVPEQTASGVQPGLDPILAAFHRARSPEAEAYRGVRTALYFSSHGKEYRIIQVTSPGMGDGKTTTVANLGVSIAQSGKRTLLVDADFRRPRLHNLFGISARIGLASVLAGEARLEEATQQSVVAGLFVLPCGPIPPNPAELLTSPRFQEILGVVRDQYDLVLIDTPPMLAVSDPAVVAPRVEGVLMVLRYSKDGRPSAQRAKQILDTLGVNVLGVVVNAVDYQSPEGKYGYVRHRYSYGYGYGDLSDHGNGHTAVHASTGSADAEAAPKGSSRRHQGRRGLRGGPPQGIFDWLRGKR
jgi:capsular exopolysaccharide synthesis family protein